MGHAVGGMDFADDVTSMNNETSGRNIVGFQRPPSGHNEEHICDICYKMFKWRSKLVEHYRIHTGEKNFKCNVCFKTFMHKSYLTKHFKIHTGEKNIKCHICSKTFMHKSYLTKHSKIHT
ncbi:unnamed protein product [Owenia fusiformis]|uniref:C2H2-type domain-containing protein n=1 Tax=Owenia fusiformis TaxID=6347 RepID=A0A8S4NNV4_OWEFU|nr:unnamed protein product [Owenia fusiformis]